MALFISCRYPPYPDNSFERWERVLDEYHDLETMARALTTLSRVMQLTPEQEAVRKKWLEAKKPLRPPECKPMRRGRRHKKIYGIRQHDLVGSGPFAFLGRRCTMCGLVKVR
ncbi:MAG: hypothetical protein COT88_02205 [Candidatus Colwellbacteria bacterium CG10_big_fil_rev_8_21_14_0_10_41_28]|uniref:Uncharacterized protein n=1 Tax=Candidatus Colwellbacteria bacterium CG10_big_fil_rev_8_21_14_0_10_41_28 TaxID=1974539 RepID=A0A2H0VGU0_9BACT|nr:MAG: hypothetical protein COT88_02205 [Candidatus Colwellbacteria bacterium CG10_big_fil_rev_8_21_14_0_10_41_28]